MLEINNKVSNKMYHGTSINIIDKAHALRLQMTEAETILWQHIRGNKLGVKFRRQHAINKFVADFYCHERLWL